MDTTGNIWQLKPRKDKKPKKSQPPRAWELLLQKRLHSIATYLHAILPKDLHPQELSLVFCSLQWENRVQTHVQLGIRVRNLVFFPAMVSSLILPKRDHDFQLGIPMGKQWPAVGQRFHKWDRFTLGGEEKTYGKLQKQILQAVPMSRKPSPHYESHPHI